MTTGISRTFQRFDSSLASSKLTGTSFVHRPAGLAPPSDEEEDGQLWGRLLALGCPNGPEQYRESITHSTKTAPAVLTK
jgi:hypothetical protein